MFVSRICSCFLWFHSREAVKSFSKVHNVCRRDKTYVLRARTMMDNIWWGAKLVGSVKVYIYFYFIFKYFLLFMILQRRGCENFSKSTKGIDVTMVCAKDIVKIDDIWGVAELGIDIRSYFVFIFHSFLSFHDFTTGRLWKFFSKKAGHKSKKMQEGL